MLKKLILLPGLLVTSMTAQAALISHFGYERDSASNIVRGGGLEWLKWDETANMSIQSALNKYATEGWRLASNDQMAALFNAFEFGKTDWDNREAGSSQNYVVAWSAEEGSSAHSRFIMLFGANAKVIVDPPYPFLPSDPLLYTGAFYGSDSNANGLYNIAHVLDDWQYVGSTNRGLHQAMLQRETWNSSWQMSDAAVALVRVISTPPSVVPTPGPIGLLALGLVALGYRRRHVLGS